MNEKIICDCKYPMRCAMNNDGLCVPNACLCSQINANAEEEKE